MRLVVPLALAVGLAVSGCVDGDIPPRPVPAGAGPVELVSAPGCGAIDFVIHNGAAFWTEEADGVVKSISTGGGRATVIATAQTAPRAIAVDASSVFWVAGQTIMKKPRVGGSAAVFVAATTTAEILGGENDINALLVDRDTLFFGRYIFAVKVPTAGGKSKVIGQSPTTDLGKPRALAVDATHLYQTEMDHLAVSREAIDGSQMGLLEDMFTKQPLAPDRIAVSQGSLLVDAIALDDGHILWANAFTIWKKAVDQLEGANAIKVTSSATADDITGFAVSGAFVYFGEARTGKVQRAGLADGVPTEIATGQANPHHFAADDQSIYWSTADCRIMKLAK